MTEKSRADPEKAEMKRFAKKVVREELAKNPRLERFLTDRGVKGQYIVNITKRVLRLSDGDKEYIRNSIEGRINSRRPIDNAFTWAATPQGHYFWSNLQEAYSEELYEDKIFYKIF